MQMTILTLLTSYGMQIRFTLPEGSLKFAYLFSSHEHLSQMSRANPVLLYGACLLVHLSPSA